MKQNRLRIEYIQHYPIGGENALRVMNLNKGIIDKLWCIRKFPEGDEFVSLLSVNGTREALLLNEIKPILRPMSDLYKPLPDGTIPIVELAKIAGCNIDLNKLPINEIETVNIVKNYEVEFKYSSGYYRYFIFRNGSFYYKTGHERRYGQDYEPLTQSNQLDLFTYLFEHHFDVFGLIEQDLAIDVNKIK